MTTIPPRIVLAAAALWLAFAGPAAAQEFDLPGLSADSYAFARELAQAHPAGATPAIRGRSEAQAAAATLRDDWTAAARALEDRLGQGETTSDLWGRLALAELRRVPVSPRHALQAAYQAFARTSDDAAKAAALVLGAQALAAQDLPAQASGLLQSAVALQPDDAALRQRLADANRATGLLVRRVAAEEDADLPRACIVFNLAPMRRADFHPEDWVRLDPQVADAAVTREGERICVSGLPLAATTRALLRAGLRGDSGLSLKSDTVVALTLGNREPLLAFDSRLFLLPRG